MYHCRVRCRTDVRFTFLIKHFCDCVTEDGADAYTLKVGKYDRSMFFPSVFLDRVGKWQNCTESTQITIARCDEDTCCVIEVVTQIVMLLKDVPKVFLALCFIDFDVKSWSIFFFALQRQATETSYRLC